jgi:hypothetical protein
MSSTQIQDGSNSSTKTQEFSSSPTKTREDSKDLDRSHAKEQLELMLRTRIREDLEDFCLINIFAGFGFDPMVFAAFGIDVKQTMFEEMDNIKIKLKEVDYEVTD